MLPVAIFLLAIPFLFGANLRGKAGEAQVTLVLRSLAADVRDDVLLPDGRGGLTQVDHLVLTPAGIWVVETKDYSGLIFGRAREKSWTQKLGKQTYRFQNPLHQNFGHIKALETALPETPVRGLVVFTGRSRFPKGEPEGVVRIEDLAGVMAPQSGEGPVPAGLRARWDALRYRLREGRDAREAHLAQVGGLVNRKFAKVVGFALVGVAFAFFVGARLG